MRRGHLRLSSHAWPVVQYCELFRSLSQVDPSVLLRAPATWLGDSKASRNATCAIGKIQAVVSGVRSKVSELNADPFWLVPPSRAPIETTVICVRQELTCSQPIHRPLLCTVIVPQITFRMLRESQSASERWCALR